MALEGAEWEQVGAIEVDSATVAIAEATHFDAIIAVRDDLVGRRDGSARSLGIEMVHVITGVDTLYPVEVAYTADGSLAGLRVEFVTDVDELDGVWRPLDSISLTSGECLVADPFCLPNEVYWLTLPSPTGIFPVEVFDWDGETLGVRAVFTR